MFVVIPLIATFAAVTFGLRRVYLAQLVGIAIAPFGVAAVFVEWMKLGVPVPPEVWPIALGGSAVLAFFAGLRLGGRLRAIEGEETREVEYKPIDTWDRDAKARYVEKPVSVGIRWGRLGWGVSFALIFYFVFPMVIQQGLGEGRKIDDVRMIALFGIGIFVGATLAASGCKMVGALVQGFWVAVIVFSLVNGPEFTKLKPAPSPASSAAIAAGLAGGIFGRFASAPRASPRQNRHQRRRNQIRRRQSRGVSGSAGNEWSWSRRQDEIPNGRV